MKKSLVLSLALIIVFVGIGTAKGSSANKY
mgnify:FL=1